MLPLARSIGRRHWQTTNISRFHTSAANMTKHHLMCGTWVKPGVIITVSFDTETLKLELVKKTEIPHDEPISWMAFDVYLITSTVWHAMANKSSASTEEHLRRIHEKMELTPSGRPWRDCTDRKLSHRWTSCVCCDTN